MPVTKTIELYSFAELDDKAKQKAIEKEREAKEFFNDCTLEELENDLCFLGFSVDCINYSVSYSQSDYANFSGSFKKENIDCEGLSDSINDPELLIIAQRLKDIVYDDTVKINPRNRVIYLEFSYEDDEKHNITDNADDDFREIIGLINDYLYKAIRDEVDHQLSDDCIIEDIEANNILFTKDGRVYND